MSGSSDSEEFFDAEDNTPNRNSRRQRSKKEPSGKSSASLGPNISSDRLVPNIPNSDQLATNASGFVSVSVPDQLPSVLAPSASVQPIPQPASNVESLVDSHESRRRFKQLRQRMQTDDEDAGVNNTSPPDSQTSSVEGVFAVPSKTTHPFRIIEHDALSLQSMTSLGRVGRILGGSSVDGVRDTQSMSSITLSNNLLRRDDDSTSDSSSIPSQSKESLVSEKKNLARTSQDSSTTVNTKPPAISTPAVLEAVSTKLLVANTRDNKHPPASDETDSAEKNQELGLARYAVVSGYPKDSTSNLPHPLPLQEPDVIASTKTSNTVIETQPIPVAPPRRKKKGKNLTPRTLTPPTSEEPYPQSCPLPSPASTIESLTREFEHSLDIRSATKGQYVVKPQDEDRSKAEGPSAEELERIERLKAELLSVCSSQASGSPMGSISSNSIGRGSLKPGHSPRGSKERRRSAGDEQGLIGQLNMFVRTRTDSGKQLTDMEILEQVTVLNLDTGERVPLSIAEDKLPQCINPLSLHIMRLTSEYVSNSSLDKDKESDEESVDSKKLTVPLGDDVEVGRVRKRTAQIKKFFGSKVKKTMNKAKSIAHARHKEDVMDLVDEVCPGEQNIKLKASGSHKGPYEFDSLQHVQDLSGEHAGPIWCMKFSACGRLLATAGQDRVLRVWVVRNAYSYFLDMRTKYNAEKVSPTPSQESLVSQQSSEDPNAVFVDENLGSPFMPKPFCTYVGHTSDLLDVAWSKNYFVLSSSMDKTVRLWHISRKECLCCFQHIDFVTAIVFHPRDDRYFLSGSLDGKLRLWNIPDKKVAVWNEVDGQTKLITAANFCQNGKFAVVGSYDGRCIFYNTDQLKYHTQIHVRSTRGKNSTGRKISGIEPMPGEDKILVTSNDSRIRLYDLRDLNLSCKYKGYVNVSSQIKASFSHDGKYIVSGSENQCIYIWKTHHDYSKFSSVRRDRNDFWEGIKAHNAVVTCAVFAPNPDAIIRHIEDLEPKSGSGSPKVEDPMVEQRTKGCGGHVLISADFNGCIKVFLNKIKPKHSSLPASALA